MSIIIEHDIESYLVKRVEALGGRCLKFIPDYDEGMPDRLIILPRGVIAFVETKRPHGGKLSAMQKYQIHKLEELGCHVYVVKNKGEVDTVLWALYE